MKTDGSVPLKSNKQSNFEKKNQFLLASCQPVTKNAGSGAVSQWCGSGSVRTNMSRIRYPQHCWSEIFQQDV
jgi:hypothetical protein